MRSGAFDDLDVVDGAAYRIRIKGRLAPRWRQRLSGFDLQFDAGDTVLTGRPKDQAQLFGVLNLVHDLGLSLLSVERIDDGVV